jgi:hypothetical protein
MDIPERVFQVKVFLVGFWAYALRNRLVGVFSVVFRGVSVPFSHISG